jgi:hypothetical protein
MKLDQFCAWKLLKHTNLWNLSSLLPDGGKIAADLPVLISEPQN